jgi:hypothetical protein
MPETITVRVGGKSLDVPVGASVAVAALIAGIPCRTSVTNQPRTPLCGMGICFECRMVINGQPHLRSCQVLCEPGMEIFPDE